MYCQMYRVRMRSVSRIYTQDYLAVCIYVCECGALEGLLLHCCHFGGDRICTPSCDWNIDNVTFSWIPMWLLLPFHRIYFIVINLSASLACRHQRVSGAKTKNNFEYITVFTLLYFYRILIMPMFHRIP